MFNKKQIFDLYNQISDRKLSEDELKCILPKLYLITNKIPMDEVEIIEIIDVLQEIKKYDHMGNITPEIVDLILKITNNNQLSMENTLYFSIILKHIILPHDKNICDNYYNLMIYLSEFEIFVELASKQLKKKDLIILDKYNSELKEVIIKYKEVMKIYNQYVVNDIMLGTIISHIVSMLYFNLDEYNYDYNLVNELVYRLMNNYQKFIDYCCSLGIHKNFTRIQKDLKGIELEYIISNEMLKYVYEEKEEEKIKRKC